MFDSFTITYRKWRSSTFSETVAAAWEEVYRKKILNPYAADLVWDRSGMTTGNREDFRDAPTTPEDSRITVPKKEWIGSRDFADLKRYPVAEPDIYTIQNCVMFGPNGLTVTETGQIVADTISPPELFDNRKTVALSKLVFEHGLRWCLNNFNRENVSRTVDRNQFDIESACPLLPLWVNYYHWTAECLPRLQQIEKRYEQTGKVTTLLVPQDPPSWISQSLDLLASDSYVTKEFTEDMYTVKELVVPTYPDPSRESCRWLKESVAENVPSQGKKSDRIYISRKQANRRRIANRDQVQEVLDEFGFESYILENLSVSEQIQLFSTAEIIISPHGAGLVNMIYAENPVIIELFGSDKKATFYRLAKILDYDYHHIYGESKGADIQIDKHKLRDLVENVVSQSTSSE